ncbi:MAG: hypothetical protein QG599_742 [Pseudomonadota bacterium]|nr:hypothetical protein [Pseudomonadota bacterium]
MITDALAAYTAWSLPPSPLELRSAPSEPDARMMTPVSPLSEPSAPSAILDQTVLPQTEESAEPSLYTFNGQVLALYALASSSTVRWVV